MGLGIQQFSATREINLTRKRQNLLFSNERKRGIFILFLALVKQSLRMTVSSAYDILWHKNYFQKYLVFFGNEFSRS